MKLLIRAVQIELLLFEYSVESASYRVLAYCTGLIPEVAVQNKPMPGSSFSVVENLQNSYLQ